MSQNYLRVALQELDSGCTAKTLQVQPHATVDDVCQLCALKFKVSEPEKYGLFLVMEGSSQQLAADTHPQKIKAELHSRSPAPNFHFVFRRLGSSSTSSSSPAALTDSALTSDPRVDWSQQHQASSAPGLSPALSLSLLPQHHPDSSISV